MTDQPKQGKDETPEGYQPPSYTPSQESEVPAPPAPSPATAVPDYEQQSYGAQGQAGEQSGQPTSPYGTAYGAPARQPYEQPYGQQPYGAPGQPYAQPGQQPYGAPAQYGQPGGPYNAYGQPGYYSMPPEPKSLSIASMCCGIAAMIGFGFFLLPQVAAVILGHMALQREPSGKGMAIAGLVMGYLGIALAVLVIVIIAIAAGSAGYTRYGA